MRVLVLAGDIDVPTARDAGRANISATSRAARNTPGRRDRADPAGPVNRVMHDRVRDDDDLAEWVVPGLNDPAARAARYGDASMLGGLASSRLDNALVREEKTAVASRPTSRRSTNQLVPDGQRRREAGRRPGRRSASGSTRSSPTSSKNGPTADEVQRAATATSRARSRAWNRSAVSAARRSTLAEGEVYSNDPAKYKKDLEEIAAGDSGKRRAAARRWMSRPALRADDRARTALGRGHRAFGQRHLAPAIFSKSERRRRAGPGNEGAGRAGCGSRIRRRSAEPPAPRIAEPPVLPGQAAAIPAGRAGDPVQRDQGRVRAPKRGADGQRCDQLRCRQCRRRQGQARH